MNKPQVKAIANNADYALGHADQELARLQIQARVLAPTTRKLISDAGIGVGMRVLDLGCGTGDVSFLLADIVGPTGTVIGIDRGQAAIDVARARAIEGLHANVAFLVGDEVAAAAGEPFDAVFTRYVLIHQADPASFLRRASAVVKPSGRVVCQEAAYHIGARCWPEVPLWNAMFSSIAAFTAAAFPNHDVAGRMVPTLTTAGLAVVDAYAISIVGGPRSEYLSYGVASYRAFLPAMTRLGLVRPEVGDPNTVEQRIESAMKEIGAQFVSCPEIGAWATVPGAPQANPYLIQNSL